jgi:tRNA (cmo5U34)-methyltransferase
MLSWTFKDWTFKDFADDFDSHVREQLPWYELVTESVAYLARNYLPKCGAVYDIGCSTGNMTKALLPLLDERFARLHAFDSDVSMVKQFEKNIVSSKVLVSQDWAESFSYENFDVAIVFLTAMFLPPTDQSKFLDNLYMSLNEGGAIIIVDKACDEGDYFATVMKRLTMYWKLKNGAKAKDILNKELSLSGIQRPLHSDLLNAYGAKQFFQLGEFKGWVIEK